MASALLASRPRGETFSSHARHTPRLTVPRLSGCGFRAAWQRPGKQFEAVQCRVQSCCCDLGVFLLPGLWSGDCAKVSLLHARPGHGHRLGSLQKKSRISSGLGRVGTLLLLPSVQCTGHGLICTAVSTVLGGLFRFAEPCAAAPLTMRDRPAEGRWIAFMIIVLCCHGGMARWPTNGKDQRRRQNRDGSPAHHHQQHTHPVDSHPVCWEYRRAAEGWHARAAAV